jgi:predicted nucleic acid-binding protein
MTALVFVDSNVLLYRRDPMEPVKRPLATAWLEHVWRERTGRTSCQVLSEFYANATRKLSVDAENAWSDVEALQSWRPQPIDADLLRMGRVIERRYRLSWWDSLIVASAQSQNCALLLTEDLQDGAHFDGVTVRSPFTLSINEAAAEYAMRPAPSRHPPRGRPRKHPLTRPLQGV